jgi:hypothetical protein
MRALRDHKRELLRGAYEAIYLAALRVQRTPVPSLATLDRAKKERLLGRLSDLREATAGLEKLKVRLMLDDGEADLVLEIFRDLIEQWRSCGDVLRGHWDASDPVSAEMAARAMEQIED